MNAPRIAFSVVAVLAFWVPGTPGSEPTTPGKSASTSSSTAESSSPDSKKHRPTLPLVSLPTTDGEQVSLSPDDETRWQVICFLGSECPLARLYGPRLQRMADEYKGQGVRFVGINSNLQDSLDDVDLYLRRHEIRFPMGKDFDRKVAVSMGVTRTPEVFVVGRDGEVHYQGRIDDQYDPGIARPDAKREFLRQALNELTNGMSVSVPHTDSVGCLISLPKKKSETKLGESTSLTYCRDISRVLNEHCIDCHRAGEIGPFSMEEYSEVVGWIDMMLEVIEDKRMPPWHATSDHLQFANAKQMPTRAKKMLQEWADGGMPYGNVSDLPPPSPPVAEWRLPQQPDLVLEMSQDAFEVPSMGTVDYQYYVIDPGFKEDKWVRAAQVIPGNASVVHHCIAFTRPTDGTDLSGFGMLSAFVPGQRTEAYPEGYALRVPAGCKIVFQMHYTPTGKREKDLTKIGLVFADPEQVTHEVKVIAGIQQDFGIPPNTESYPVEGQVRSFPDDGLLLSILPHMHVRGRSFQLNCQTNDRKQETLLEVPNYDFNWQHSYDLIDPLPLGSIRDIDFVATFDNSEKNPTNPDPDEYVTWGDQTWQEMALVFLVVATPRETGGQAQPRVSEAERQKQIAKLKERHAELKAKAAQFADKYVAKHDKNGDGSVAVHELPNAVRRFGYLDHNGDSVVSREELINSYIWNQNE